jgi:thioredoxin-related protein
MRPLTSIFVLAVLASSLAAAQATLQLNPKLYDPAVNARKEIAETLRQSAKDHKRIILVFGGNWCFDCHVLDYRFHENGIREVVDQNYHVVHIDIGQYDKNLDLPEKYGTTIKKGVPAISILSPTGKVLFGDTTGEFEKARSMNPNDLLAFLDKWKK